MIRVEVVFDKELILINNHSVLQIFECFGGAFEYQFFIDGVHDEKIKTLEQAIKYCLEN